VLVNNVLSSEQCAGIRRIIESNRKKEQDEENDSWSATLNAEIESVWLLGLVKGWEGWKNASPDDKALLVCVCVCVCVRACTSAAHFYAYALVPWMRPCSSLQPPYFTLVCLSTFR
jgi:hypothetical protein